MENSSVGINGLSFVRMFTRAGTSPLDQVEWERRSSVITEPNGKVVFRMDDVEVPKAWSQLATDIAVSKYFRKAGVNGGAETSVRQLVTRVARTIRRSGEEQGGYFATPEDAQAFEDELTYLLVHQYGAFNSPVWFNVGLWHEYGITGAGQSYAWKEGWEGGEGRVVRVENSYERPQSSACFIQGVDDSLEGIMRLLTDEVMLFKYGSGTGSNFSNLRGEKELLSGGGRSSGLMSFLEVYDRAAGAIKSGGTTRRAAKMVCLNMDHPDIEKFITWKVREERKAKALIAAGYPSDFNGEAYGTVSGQNSNNSVRVTDEFMWAVEEGREWKTIFRTTGAIASTYKARDLWRTIAECAWECADPGVQFDTTINKWHTVPNSGRINASNPCSEYMHLDDTACNLASLNLTKFLMPDRRDFNVAAFRHAVRIFFVAQEILVDLASYPTEKIAKNSHDYRPLGIGYANLGTLLMLLGLPYDSDEGRSLAGAITATMTGHAYKTSAEMARSKGTFVGFPTNRAEMLDVMANHEKEALKAMDEPGRSWKGLWAAAVDDWDGAVGEGVKFGYRNAQASVLAPTGCLVAGAMVATDRGLARIEDLGDVDGPQWQNIAVNVQTDEGPKLATKFYVNGVADVAEAETLRGFALRGTTKHQIKVVGEDGVWEWRRLDMLRIGDLVPLAMHQIIGDPQKVQLPLCPPSYRTNHNRGVTVPRAMTPALAELVGAFMANGSFHAKGLRFSMFGGDNDAISRYVALCRQLFGVDPTVETHDKYKAICMNSTQVRDWWSGSGFTKLPGSKKGKGHTARTPEAVLAANDARVYGAYLRGLFTSDGTVHAGIPSLSNKDKKFVLEVQTLMMALGIPTTMDATIGGKGKKPVYRLRVASGLFCQTFVDKVGFSATRKAALVSTEVGDWSRADFIPIPKQLLDEICPIGHEERATAVRHLHDHRGIARHVCIRLLNESGSPELARLMSFFYDKIHDVKPCGQEPTYDLSVPENVTYVANSFVSHNTIGLLMDCDTTGVEPDFALIKFKKLAGGGCFKIVNNAVQGALQSLGYGGTELELILDHIGGVGHFHDHSHHGIDRRTLSARGLTRDEIAAAERALLGAFELEHCFAAHVIGTAAYERLNISPTSSLLKAIGYSSRNIEEATKAILGHQTIEGAPYLNPDHLPVFDCANRCGKYGTRFIEPMGHIKMMAAVQPFISGAISKTVNLPNEYTVEGIADLYETSWRMGLKAVALYRDGCKASQPLSTGGGKKEEGKGDESSASETLPQRLENTLSQILKSVAHDPAKANELAPPFVAQMSEPYKKALREAVDHMSALVHQVDPSRFVGATAEDHPTVPTPPPVSPPTATRLRLPTTRHGVTQEAIVGGHKLFLRTGEYADGRCGEIFIDMHKEGAAFRSLMNCFAIAVSMGLQHGIPLETFVEQFTFTRFEPQGSVQGDPHVKIATSIVDYIFRNLGVNYCARLDLAHVDPASSGVMPRSQERRAPATGAVDMKALSDHFAVLAEVAKRGGGMDAQLDELMGDAPVCDGCGHITVRNGSCYRCLSCGNSMGCS